MNRIDRLFDENTGEILSIYITAGYPALNDTPTLLKALAAHGADMIEIGIPFSDPLADGPVIQHSSQIALKNGMSLDFLFKQLKDIRDSIDIPLLLMGYLNPVLQMGVENFLENCRSTGIDGVIIPDLPPDEYESRYRKLFQSFGIHHVLLVTPHTGTERIQRIAALSSGFLYLVSDSSTTGSKSSVAGHQLEYFQRIQKMNLPLPSLIGFGISNHETFMAACAYARGAIIGSAFIRALAEEEDLTLDQKVKKFIGKVKGG
ncbi:MAG: tryptophan synthase subunit alpha [Bacteroidota bacterium]